MTKEGKQKGERNGENVDASRNGNKLFVSLKSSHCGKEQTSQPEGKSIIIRERNP